MRIKEKKSKNALDFINLYILQILYAMKMYMLP